MLVNGVPKDSIAINDRALAYGDGLFETIRLHDGQAIYLDRHLSRLQAGCERLGIPYDQVLLQSEIKQLAPQFKEFGILKIILTRGAGGRGYRPAADVSSNRILTLHALPDYSQLQQGVKAFLCQQRLSLQPALAGIKHLNRLEQVLASQEWPGDEFQEGIMLDTNGLVIEGTKSNVFIVEVGTVITPNLQSCGVNGVMRQSLIEAFNGQIKVEELSLKRLLQADEVFLCNSVFGVWPLLSLTTESQTHQYKVAEFSRKAQAVFAKALRSYET